jgi:hypothetical protein
VRGITTAKSEAFQGRHAERLMLVYDEAVGIEANFFEVGRSMITGSPRQGWVCFYNPTNPGSQVYREESSGQWNSVTMSQFDHPNIAAELAGQDPPYPSAVRLSQVVRDMDNYGARIDPDKPPQDGEVALSPQLRWLPGPLADCRILGRWPRGLGNNVWSDGLWERMEKVRLDVNPDWFVQIGCDVAAYGLDETAIVVKQGPCVLHAERHNGWGPRQTMNHLKELCHRYCGRRAPQSVACLIDAAGVGLGVADYANGYHFVPILSAKTASDAESYNNRRTELWFRAQKFAQVDLIDISRLPDDERRRLKVELLAPTYDFDPMNRLRVEPKKITKKKLRHSPDLADAFNLACYWLYPAPA